MSALGKYRLVKLVATGGMAEVYLAKAAGPGGFEKSVCLKRILPHLARDEAFVNMFLNEARLAASLDHPNIVQIFDLGETGGNYFIAMEFIDGPNLRAAGNRARELSQPLPVPEVMKIVSLAAGGLHYAHSMVDGDGKPLNLVHRDISPDNVLVHKNGSVKVVDFGIAKAAEGSSGQTRTGTLKGKIAYMPPEQLRGDPLDRRADVYALGVVLYELVAGKRPFEGGNEMATMNLALTTDPAPLTEVRPGVPAALDSIVARALAKNRDDRYADCATLQADLEQLLVNLGESVTTPRIAALAVRFAPPDVATPAGQTLSMEEVFGSPTVGVAPPPRPAMDFDLTGAATSHGKPAPAQPLAMFGVPPAANAAASGDETQLLGAGQVARHSPAITSAWMAAAALAAVVSGSASFAVAHARFAGVDNKVEMERALTPNDPPREAPPGLAAATPPPLAPPPAPAVVPAPAAVGVAAAATPTPKAASPKRATEARFAPGAATPPPAAPPVAPVNVQIMQREPPKPIVVNLAPAAPAPTVAVAAEPKNGRLVITVLPWAHVEVDGQGKGDTPMAALTLPAGVHKVRLWNEELGKDLKRQVVVPPGGTETIKEVLTE